MADARFFDRHGPFRLRDILACSELEGFAATNLDREFDDVGPLDTAEPGGVSFLDNPKYLSALKDTRAGACFIDAAYADHCPDETIPIITATPYLAFAKTAVLFYPAEATIDVETGGANVHATATFGKMVRLGFGATVGAHADIGDGTILAENVHIGRGVVIGKNCVVHHSSTVTHSQPCS